MRKVKISYNGVMKNISLDVLTSVGCIPCEEFMKFWNTIKGEWGNVTMMEYSILSPEGQAMVLKYQIFASPAIIINEEVFAVGGFHKEKFIEKLSTLSSH